MTRSDSAEDLGFSARMWTQRAMSELVRELGGEFEERPAAPGAASGLTVKEPEPIAGIRAGRQLELAARSWAYRMVGRAREQGHTWREIGDALGITVHGDVAGLPDSVAELAYEYVAGDRDSARARMCGRSFMWKCQGCGGTIKDFGPELGNPHDSEAGHAGDCARFAAAVVAWGEKWSDEEGL